MNVTGDHAFVTNVASKNLWAILQLPKTFKSSIICGHRDRGVRPTLIDLNGEREAWRAAWCLSGDSRRASGLRVSTR